MNPNPNHVIVTGTQASNEGLIVHVARDPRYDPAAAVFPTVSVLVPHEILEQVLPLIEVLRRKT